MKNTGAYHVSLLDGLKIEINFHDCLTKNPSLSWEFACSFVCSCDRKIDGVRVLICSPSSLLFRFGTLEQQPVPQYEEMAGENEIWFNRGCNWGNECTIWALEKSYYSEGIN